MANIVEEWRRLSDKLADVNGRACEAAEEAKRAMRVEAERGIPYSALTAAKFDTAFDLLAETRQVMFQLIDVHTKLFPDDRKIFEVKAMVETRADLMETFRNRLHPN